MARVADLMTEVVVTAAPEDTLGEVRSKMSSLDIGALPVVGEGGEVVGIVTTTDLLGNYEATLPVSRVMTSPVETVDPDTPAAEAARRMRGVQHHHLVVAEAGKVTGMVSSLDLLRLVAEG